jgi:nicotinate phosphoribosyltransferase
MAISSAPPIGFTADIKEVAGQPRTKRGRIPGATPNPLLKKVI